MTDREHNNRGTARKRLRQPPVVEMRIPKRKIDVDAWLGSFVEREVEREVHTLADKSPAEADRNAPPRGDLGSASEDTTDRLPDR